MANFDLDVGMRQHRDIGGRYLDKDASKKVKQSKHGVFLAFYIFVESLSEGRTPYLPHGFRKYFRGCWRGYCDEHL